MFSYTGDISELQKEVSLNRDHLRLAFFHLLGQDLYAKLEKADGDLLGGRSFPNVSRLDPSKSKDWTLGSWFSLMSDFDRPRFEPDGTFTGVSTFRASPLMFFSRQSFEREEVKAVYQDWIPPCLGEYIHEYCHFTIFALQLTPFQIVERLLLTPHEEIVEALAVERYWDYARTLTPNKGSAARLAYRFYWATANKLLGEISARELERAVHVFLGHKMPANHRLSTLPPSRHRFPDPRFSPAFDLSWGDFLYESSPRDRIRLLTNWFEKVTPENNYQANFLRSLRSVEIIRSCFSG